MKQTFVYFLSNDYIDGVIYIPWIKGGPWDYEKIINHPKVEKYLLSDFVLAFNDEHISDHGVIATKEEEVLTNGGLTRLEEEFEQYKKHSISWSIEDFETQAANRCDGEWKNVYDETKFEETLENMIRHHDAIIGITWDTIDYYLEEYCRKPEKEKEKK
jgi:hypothetical protein